MKSKVALAKRIDALIVDWFKTTGREEAKPKDLMPFLVEHGIFRADHREGLPLRKLLCELDRLGELSIMTTVRFEQRPKNKLWYFVPPGISRRTRPAQLRAAGPASHRVGGGWRVSADWRGRDVETLADIVSPDLRVLFVGLNPSPVSVAAGHYHQGRLGKQFWQLLVAWDLLDNPPVGQYHDDSLPSRGYGITDLVKVPSARADELDAADVAAGREILVTKITELRPRLVCSIYKAALEATCGKSWPGRWGLLDERLGKSRLFLLPFPYRSRVLIDKHMSELAEFSIEVLGAGYFGLSHRYAPSCAVAAGSRRGRGQPPHTTSKRTQDGCAGLSLQATRAAVGYRHAENRRPQSRRRHYCPLARR